MAKENYTETTADVQKLRSAVENVDSISQKGLSEISSITRMALSWLENPDNYRDLDVIAVALNAIWEKAEHVQNDINCEAESVGCNYIDSDERRRWEAQRIAACAKISSGAIKATAIQ